MNTQEYYTEFMQDIYMRSGVSEEIDSIAFTERMCEFLIGQALIDEYAVVGYKKESLGIRVDAWQINEDAEVLRLFISDFRSGDELLSLTQTDVVNSFRRLERFFERSVKSNFSQLMEESDPAFGLAHTIFNKLNDISKVHFVLLSNGELSSRVQHLDDKDIQGFKCTYDIWDLSRLFRIESSGDGKEEIIVNLNDYYPDGIPSLAAYTGTDDYESYLLVMPGNLIADLYDQYGEQLLEQNVRTFLQFRGNVNRGLRNTLLNEPEMFFAYNNGLSATAESVIFQDGETRIKSIKNLQIVNGGQTMASIFTAKKKSKADLSNVYVQMKLSIIPFEKVETVVPKISEYANTQNKVNAADFFSNHPFHLRIEEFSRRLWAPSPEGGIRESHWYYERARGQYGNAQANLTSAQQKQFLATFPRSQMFVKTDLAKYEHSCNMLPHTVSLGAQKNFARFASEISKEWEKKEEQFNQLYFQRVIAKAIIFKFLDKSVLKQPWYGGGFKANIVTYSVAKLMYSVLGTGKYLNLTSIWSKQKLSKALEEQLLAIAEAVNEKIQQTPPEITNVTEWCKRETCWYQVKQMPVSLSQEFISELIDEEDNTYIEKDAEKYQKIDDGISVQTHVVNQGADYWKSIKEWNETKQILSPMELSILNISCTMPATIPTEKQSVVLVNVEKRVIDEGYPSL